MSVSTSTPVTQQTALHRLPAQRIRGGKPHGAPARTPSTKLRPEPIPGAMEPAQAAQEAASTAISQADRPVNTANTADANNAALNRTLARYKAAKARYHQAKAALKAAERRIVPVDAFGKRKPRLRGWLHLITLPLCIAASIVLICIAPAGPVKAACAMYGASAMLLFGNSALLHVVPWRSAKVTRVLCGIDYSNIFLIIAGTNTPVLFALSPAIRRPYLTVIWVTAAVGTILHIVWLQTPNWVFTTVYVVLGLAPVTLIPQLWAAPAVGPAPTVPGWFEFHEMFHLGTVIGYTCHVVAIYLIVCAL